MACSFDPDTNKILVVYEDVADSNKGKAVVGTISGTSISYGFRGRNWETLLLLWLKLGRI